MISQYIIELIPKVTGEIEERFVNTFNIDSAIIIASALYGEKYNISCVSEVFSKHL